MMLCLNSLLQTKLNQSIAYMIGNSFLRFFGVQLEDPMAFEKLKDRYPRLSNYIVWGSTEKVSKVNN